MAFEIIASINTSGSIKEISEKLKNEVANGVNSQKPLKIIGSIDVQKTVAEINKNLNSLNSITIKNIGIDNSAIKNVQSQVKSIADNVKREFDSLLTTSNKVKDISNNFATLKQRDISPIQPVVDTNGLINVDKTIASLKNRFAEFKNVVGNGTYGNDGQLNGITVSMNNADGEARKLTFTLKELDNEIKTLVFDGGSYTDKGVEKQFEKADIKAKALTSTIEKLKAKYTDLGSVKPIKDENSLTLLSDKYKEIETAINKVGSANSSNMNKLESDAKVLISEYERLAVSLQNAEYMATSLRTKDIGTIQAIAKQDLTTFENQIKNSKVPIQEMNNDLAILKSTLSQTLNKEQLTNYLNSFDVAKSKFKALEEQYKSNGNEAEKYYSRWKKAIVDLNKVQIQKMKAVSPEEIQLLDAQIKRLKERARYNEKQINKKNLTNNEYLSEINSLKSQFEYEQKLLNTRIQGSKIKSNIKEQENELNKYNNTITQTISKLNSVSNLKVFEKNSSNSNVVAMQGSISSLTQRLIKLQEETKNIKTPEQLKDFQNKLESLSVEFNKIYGNAKNLSKYFSSDNSTVVLSGKIQTLRGQIEKFISANPKAMRNGYKNQFDNLLNSLNKVSNANAFNNIKMQFQKFTSEIDKLGLRGTSVLDTLKEKFSKFASWMGVTMITASVAREIRGMYSTIIELDTSLVDLNKTFTGTSTDLEEFYYSANKVAKQLGATTKDVIDSASSWSRLGYSSKEASLAMAEYSSIFKSISPGMTIDEATDGLVSMMKAFGVEVDDVQTQIMDKVNIIGNTLALSNSDIVESMKRSSSALKLANNSIAESIALNAASIEVTQNAEKSGNAWKTISMRLRGYDEETEELSEDLKNITGEIADLTKVASNNYQGVSLFTDETKETYKSTYQIMSDISKIWDELSDKNQAKLLEKMAGKMNSQVLGSAIINWKNAEKAMRTMEESYGSSQNEMEKYYDSLEYKINNFKETIVEIAQSTITRDFLKGIINDSTTMLETFANFGSVLKPMYSLIGSGVSLVAGLTESFGGLDKVIAGFAISKGINALSKGLFGADRTKDGCPHISMSA